MATRIYGYSDDLIVFEGTVTGEVYRYDTSQHENALIICSDGTLLKAWYGKDDKDIWAITLVEKGSLFLSIDQCVDEDADPYSDVAHFADGLKWAYVASEWEKVQ